MRKVLRIVLVILLSVFVGIQFIRPAKNVSEEIGANDITAKYHIPDEVHQILKVSCYDCHSNNTYYPWYWQVQPVMWFMNDHINEGKRHLNFSEFSSYAARRRYKKLKEISKEIKSGDMPLRSYTMIHRDAVLSPAQKITVENWINASLKEMETTYPADSLKKK
ncbi:MAG TPA: heme-binding domain-containing protein [Hanamia sp.]|nr:heme-binding domain-containing protein [Hanamia sp.]